MTTITEPNEYSVEGAVTSGEGKQRVIMTQTVDGSQLTYSEDSVECVVENAGGKKQRCVCVYVFSDGSNNPENFANVPTSNGNYRIRLTINNGVATYSWVAE